MDMYRDGGLFMITLSTPNSKDVIEEVTELVLGELKKVKKGGAGGVGATELKTFKDYMIGNWSKDLNDPDEMSEFFGVRYVIAGNVMTKKQYLDGIKKVTVKSVQAAAKKLFREEALNLCVLAK